MGLNGFKHDLSHGMGDLEVLYRRPFKAVSPTNSKSTSQQIRPPRKRSRKSSVRHSLLLYNGRTPVARPAAQRAEKPKSYTERLKCLYHMDDVKEVFDFLKEHPFLPELLVEAHRKIEGYFGKGTRIILEMFDDPEEPEFRMLNAFIVTKLTPREAHLILDRFDKEWWLDVYPRSQGYINISFSYAS